MGKTITKKKIRAERSKVITMEYFMYILLCFLVVCAIAVSFSKSLLNSVLVFMSYSLVMSIVWVLLESPDLAITEAAVGAGVTSVLFFITLKKIEVIRKAEEAGKAAELLAAENENVAGEEEKNEQAER